MGISPDGKAEVFLKKHGPLIHELVDHRVMLTLDGRVFIITFLNFYDYITPKLFQDIAFENEQQPGLAAFKTGEALRNACEKWVEDNKQNIARTPDGIVPPTDVSYRLLEFLMKALIAAQLQLERAALRQKV